MSRIVEEKCSGCGMCKTICPLQLIDINKKTQIATFSENHMEMCIKCGHCMAICPKKAITIDGLNYESNFKDFPSQTDIEGEESMQTIIQRRRSVRFFQKKTVPAEIINKIIQDVSFAPVSFPPHRIHITVVTNQTVLSQTAQAMHESYIRLNRAMQNRIIRHFIKKKVDPATFVSIQDHLMKILPIMRHTFENRIMNKYTYNAPVMMLFHAPQKEPSHKIDGIICLTYAMLSAARLGLGSIILEILSSALNNNKGMKVLYNIPKNHEVVGALLIGYQKHAFQRSIHRSFNNIHWIK